MFGVVIEGWRQAGWDPAAFGVCERVGSPRVARVRPAAPGRRAHPNGANGRNGKRRSVGWDPRRVAPWMGIGAVRGGTRWRLAPMPEQRAAGVSVTFCARRGGGSCSRRMGFTLALTHLSFGASRRRRRSEAGRDTMLPRQSQMLDTDDTDDTDRNGQKSVGAACVYPCPMPWSV